MCMLLTNNLKKATQRITVFFKVIDVSGVVKKEPTWSYINMSFICRYYYMLIFSINSWVLLAWISRYPDNLDSEISSLFKYYANLRNIVHCTCIYHDICISCIIFFSKIAQDLGQISHYLGCQDIQISKLKESG